MSNLCAGIQDPGMLRSESEAEIADGELQDLLERVTLSGEELPEGLRATICKMMSPITQ